jgi:hypothetical protein
MLIGACLVVAASAPSARGAIRVVEDEVYFTLVAPGAKEVFLVGDFNNWNPTVEKMYRSGDTFEISLYMVEGSYRYKFVVDGKWIVDPDNPGYNPAKGSPLTLIEKPAGLVLSTEDLAEEEAPPVLAPAFRYIGQFSWNLPEDRDFEDRHVLDLDLSVDREKLRGRALLKSTNVSPAGIDWSSRVTMDRGYVGTEVGELRLVGFENDAEVWTSSDPVTLVGDLGVFDYNAGYDRKGISAEYRLSEPIRFRAVYADHSGALVPHQPAIADTAGSWSGADTTAYAYDRRVGDSDLFGFQFNIESSSYRAGIVTRRNYGVRPGAWADVSSADSAATVYDTRENTTATFYWIGLENVYGFGATVGYGSGRAEIHQLTRELVPVRPPRPIQTTQGAEGVDLLQRFETSDRFYASADRTTESLFLAVDWDRTQFEFGEAVYDDAKATVDRITGRCQWSPAGWAVAGWLQYTRQGYGGTPPDLVVDSPARNLWLDWRDEFTVPNIVGVDTDSYTDVSVEATWYAGRAETEAQEDDRRVNRPMWMPPALRVEVGTTTDGFLERFEYTRARATVSYLFRDRHYAMADGRVASYDKPGWGPRETFVSGLIEFGVRYRWLGVELGWGFDPVVFDPVVNEYQDIGRERVLRESVAGGVERGRSAELGERLLRQERWLENNQTISLEVNVRF